MKPLLDLQMPLIPSAIGLPPEVSNFPRFRYMGSKFRLLPWINETLSGIDFETATDAFSGSGVVSYLLKAMGKQVRANDALAFPSVLTSATVANNATRLNDGDLEFLLSAKARLNSERFIRTTFDGIFYTPAELSSLDDLWSGIRQMDSPYKRALTLAAIASISPTWRNPLQQGTIGQPGAKNLDDRGRGVYARCWNVVRARSDGRIDPRIWHW